MFVYILPFFHQFLGILSLEAIDYASICAVTDVCRNFRKHVMCEDGPISCGTKTLSNSTKSLEATALHLFNSLRDSFGDERRVPDGFSVASDMNEIAWCDELGAFASKSVRLGNPCY